MAGEAPLGYVDESGYLHLPDGWRLEWWVAGDDYWHVPVASTSRRQRAVDNTPVFETTMRVPGGDVVWRAAAVANGDGGAIVIEFDNHASIPVALGIALVAPPTVHDPLTRPSVHFVAPARSAIAELGVELLVHPVTHGSTWRGSIGGDNATPPASLPDCAAAARGWLALVRQGAKIALGDRALDDALTAARTSLLLHQGRFMAGRRRAGDAAGAVASGLALLGYESQADALRFAARLRPRRKGLPLVAQLSPALATDPFALLADPAVAAATVAFVRTLLVDDQTESRVLDLLPGVDAAWRGRPIDVVELPTNWGPISFALRWHGEHPALLWEAPPRVTLRARALDPDWSTTEVTGEAMVTGVSS